MKPVNHLWTVAAIAIMLIAACGGKSKEAAATPTPAPSPTPAATPSQASARARSSGTSRPAPAQPVVAADCLKGLNSYRFDGRFNIQLGSGTAGNFLSAAGDSTFSGAFAAPDRTQLKLSTKALDAEAIQIGQDSWVHLGSQPWTKLGQNGSPLADISPQAVCEQLLTRLDGQGRTPGHDTVNGTPALRYQFDKQALERMGVFEGEGASAGSLLPDGTSLTIWVTEKERYPVKLTITGGKPTDTAFVDVGFTIHDLNDPSIKIQQPS